LRVTYGSEMRSFIEHAVFDAWKSGGMRSAVGAALAQAVDLLRTAARTHSSVRRRRVVRAVPLAAAAVLGVILLRNPAPAAVEFYAEFTVNAVDPAGPFTLTLRDGRVISGTLSGVPLPPHRLRQAGRDVEIIHDDGSVLLALELEPPGTIRWQARSP
jgi:hypothetical protein